MTVREQKFRQTVLDFYRTHGRHNLPWRKTTNPYRIVVSELMLQQTQVDRVLPKYRAFIKTYPTAAKLAVASLGDVLRLWQGLGYNRRAKLLHQCAQVVTNNYQGRWPKTFTDLQELPGIGPYTAGAVMAFAYNEAVPLIETNVRTVYLYHFFQDQSDVSDAELLQLIERTVDTENPREWYWALMDYGSYLKKTYGNQNQRSKTYTKQSTFKGSDRQIRGAIIRTLSAKAVSRSALLIDLSQFEDIRIDAQLEKLLHEGMVIEKGRKYRLP